MSSQLVEAQQTPVRSGHRQNARPIALVLVVKARQMLTILPKRLGKLSRRQTTKADGYGKVGKIFVSDAITWWRSTGAATGIPTDYNQQQSILTNIDYCIWLLIRKTIKHNNRYWLSE
jgi:hypothetical protein